MNAQTVRVNVAKAADGVVVDVVTPDGELITLGAVSEPSQLPSLMMNVASYVALLLVNAAWEVRSS